jgi:Ferritin-like
VDRQAGAGTDVSGKLPGPVLPGLDVRLRRCSIEQDRDVFVAIEQPEYPVVDGQRFTGAVIDSAVVSLDRASVLVHADDGEMAALEDWYTKAEYTPMTIGWFYNQIARAIIRPDRSMAREGEKRYSGGPKRQVSWPEAPGKLYRVTDRRSALPAIYEIIEQGEGSPLDLDDDNIPDSGEFGHYYRFKEIVEGRRLVRNSAGHWVYEGPPIGFDPNGVYPMADDPGSSKLPSGSAVLNQTVLSNKLYTDLLAGLQRVFNGAPDELRDIVSLMYSLQVESRKLFTMPVALGAVEVAGPPFQSSGVPW